MNESIFKKFFLRIFVILFIVVLFWIIALYFMIQRNSVKEISEKLHQRYEAYQEKMAQVYGDEAHRREIEKIFQSDANLLAIEVLKKDKTTLFRGIKKSLSAKNRNLFDTFAFSEGDFTHKIVEIKDGGLAMLFSKKIESKDFNGYIKAIFLLDKYFIRSLKKSPIYIIAIVITTILLIVITIFPLLYRQYQKLHLEQYKLLRSNIAIISALGEAVAKRDSDTDEHNYRVTIYSIELAKKLNLKKRKIRGLIKGAFLHDVGKIGIEDNILLKPEKLSKDEFEKMKRHVELGLEIIKGIGWLQSARNIIGYHHEKVDGTGYPNGLKGEEIPIEARIFAVVDVFDALTSKRPYKEPFSLEKALKILKEDSGTHFDKNIVDKFEEIAEEIYNNIKNKNKNELKFYLQEVAKPFFEL